ncbi:MAG: acyl carrier protein [Helicobacteraceae bacterium]|jgi:acyl carrier protein|nr:acyl carrier protein [Helicobacteraceae bacterium]
MKEKLAQILSSVLGKEVLANEDISMQSESLWDSMRHIEIVMTIEEEFNIAFAAEDIPYLTSKSAIERKLAELGL